MMTFLIIAAIVFCFIALIAEDFGGPIQRLLSKNRSMTRTNNRSRRPSRTDSHPDVYCPECGSPNVTVYNDGSCFCQDCEFPFHVDYL